MLTIQVINTQKHKSCAEELLPSTPRGSRLGSWFGIPVFLTATETKFRPSYIKNTNSLNTFNQHKRFRDTQMIWSLLTCFILHLQYCALVKSERLWKKYWNIIKLHKTWKAGYTEWLQTLILTEILPEYIKNIISI